MVRVIFLPLLVFLLIGVACTGGSGLQEPAVETENGSPGANTVPATSTEANPMPASTGTETQAQETALPLSPTMVVNDDGDEVATAAPDEQARDEAGAFSLAAVERLARANLAEALDIPEAQIEIVDSHAQTWPDEALGCETSRRIVVEALPVDGYQIVLAVGEEMYDYRADGQGRVELCPEAEDVGKPLDPIR